jgi:hypothetical protein
MKALRANTSWLPDRESILTESVPKLAILFRFAHKLTQFGFDSHALVPRTIACLGALK